MFASCPRILPSSHCSRLAARTYYYPPKSDSSLRTLHQRVCETDISAHHRLSVFYYIMLDYEDREQRDAVAGVAEIFAHRAGLPSKFQTMMRGLWFLDHEQFEVRLPWTIRPLPWAVY